MKRRVRASTKMRKRLEDLFEGCEVGASERSELVKLVSQLIIEEALESEADDRLGRGYYVVAGTTDTATAIERRA